MKNWLVQLYLCCAKLLIQERTSLEQNNLEWKAEEKKYQFKFNPTELENYLLVDLNFLGKEKNCINKSTKIQLGLKESLEIINNIRIAKEYSQHLNDSIEFALNQARTICPVIVLLLSSIIK